MHVSMEIDYGRILGGREILQSLCRRYAGDVAFTFHPQGTTCLANGSFTGCQAFSSELLRCFQGQQRSATPGPNARPGKNSTPDRRRSADQAAGDGSSLQSVQKTQAEGKSPKATREGPPPRNPTENHPELLEDFSLVMDSDLYLYMRKFYHKEFSSILLQHHVGVVDVRSEGIATLYLQAAAPGAGALASAHLAVSRLSQQLEAALRRERVSQRDLGGVEGARGLLGELQRLCPRLLCHQEEEHLSFIGNKADVSQAKQYVQGFIAAREAAQVHQILGVPQAASVAQIRGKSPTPVQQGPSAEFLPSKGSLPRGPSGKMGCKLATRFNAATSSAASRASLLTCSSRDAPLVGVLPGDSFQAAGSRPAETRSDPLPGALAAEPPGGQEKQSLETRDDSPAATPGGPLPSRPAWRSLGPEPLLPFGAPSSAVRSFRLFGAAGDADPKASDLGRPNRSVLPKRPQSRRGSVDEPLPVARIPASSREGSLRVLQQDASQDRRGQEAALPIHRPGLSSSPLPAVQGAGELADPPDHWECFGYSELAVEGPEDEALADLCRGLQACPGGVVVSRGRHHLGLRYPREAKQQVLEALHSFSARRLADLTEQLLSQDPPQGTGQGDASETAIRRRPQQIGKGSSAGLLERPPRPLGRLAGEDLSSWGQKFPEASQPAAEQNFPSDGTVGPSRKLAQASVAGEEGRPGESGPEAQHGWPGRRHLARGSSGQERGPREAELPKDQASP